MISPLPELAAGTREEINSRAWFVDTDDWRNVFVNYAPFMAFARADDSSNRACMGTLVISGVASVREVAKAFDVSHGLVHKLARRIRVDGLDGVYAERRGPQGPSKMTREVRKAAARMIREGKATRAVAAEIGERFGITVSHNTIALLRRKKGLARPEPPRAPEQAPLPMGTGGLVIVPADLDGVETNYGGAFLYFAALAQLDLVGIWKKTFAWGQKLGYMLSEVVLALVFLMILRYPTVESTKKAMRRHLAPLLGLDCAPSIPTLRRKIRYLAAQKRGGAMLRAYAEQASKAELVQLGVLYIDGHFKPYYGKAPVSKGYFSQRRLPHPGLIQYFVNDIEARPVFFLTVEAHVSLIQSLRPILQEIRQLIGDEALLTLVFDRGGYSFELFQWMKEQSNLRFITYEKGGRHEPCPDEHFATSWVSVAGKRETYRVCDRIETHRTCGELRRLVVQRDSKQTPILTNDLDRSAANIAWLMFKRWGSQENFFAYMKQQYKLDALIGYGDEESDAERQVTNPAKKAMKQRIAEVKAGIEFYKAQLGDAVTDPYHAGRSVKGLKISEGVSGEIADLTRELGALQDEYKRIPAKVSLKQVVPESEVRRLKLEKKILVDTLKMQAYLAEDVMVQRLSRHYDDPKDIHQVLQILTRCPARLSVAEDTLTVEFEPPERPKYERALRGLCTELTAEHTTLPWGRTRHLVFKVRDVEQVSTAA